MSFAFRRWLFAATLPLLAAGVLFVRGQNTPAKADLDTQYAQVALPLVQKYCLSCHSTKAHKGDLDLERFGTLQAVRKHLKPWQQAIEQLETEEMPPKGKPQPTEQERKQLLGWIRGFLDTEARAKAGDPGRVPLRRLSNFEYDCTIRDLTGVELAPTKEFPADGAAGEGFTNAGEALSDITPALFSRYLAAAKESADHAVLLPDGFRFSASKTRQDRVDEETERLRKFYAAHAAPDGRLPVQAYLAVTVRHRAALLAGETSIHVVAEKERVNAKYLNALWQALTDATPSYPLDSIRQRWRKATEKDVQALAGEIASWQTALWKNAPISSYIQPVGAGYAESLIRQLPADPSVSATQSLKLAIKPPPGQTEAVLYLRAQNLGSVAGGQAVWSRPRFEAAGKPPLLLRDYPQFGLGYEVDIAAAFADTAKYLEAVANAGRDPKANLDDLAKERQLDVELLQRWRAVLALTPARATDVGQSGLPVAPLALLTDKLAKNPEQPTVFGWRKAGTDLPVLVTNASNELRKVPGTILPHGVAVHPTPSEYVAVAWKSPINGKVQIDAHVIHAHNACGNGIAWWLEHRRGDNGLTLAEDVVDRGAAGAPTSRSAFVKAGDLLVLAVDPRNNEHSCDLTDITFKITEDAKPARTWDLAADVADTVADGNPHADRQGNKKTWSFVRGPARKVIAALLPPDSSVGKWRTVALDPARQPEAAKLALEVQALLARSQTVKGKGPDEAANATLTALDGPLLKGLNLARLSGTLPKSPRLGLTADKFSDTDLVTPANTTIEIRLPATLLREREFVVEGRLDGDIGDRIVQFQVSPTAPRAGMVAKAPVVASPTAAGYQQLRQGFDKFRAIFPQFLCFAQVIPLEDNGIALKMFHREDDALTRLFLDAKQAAELDRDWAELLFISRQPVSENDYLPQMIGFVSQDQPKAMLEYFQNQRPVFKKKADDFIAQEQAALPKQLDTLLDFAGRAFRRPLRQKEQADLRELYQVIRKKGAEHEEAFRGVVARILVSPSFLFRVENAPPGIEPRAVDDWELASRLSYFLWSSAPDDELRRLAAAGSLRDPKIIEAQTRRLIEDPRLRALAIEFGTQWIHVRGIDQLKEKNETLFPMFDAKLRSDIYEESILFFQDFFQHDRPVAHILDADATYLNENLAKYYGIPGVTGPQWRRIEGVRKYGRGGILGLASVQAKQSGASRTSPVLRGNWVVETLLGEKLPRPPADVPILPDVAGGTDNLTTRQMVEKHVSVASCAACHIRIDPLGFAFEKYDPIGRFREKEANGQPIDARAKLRDGTQFEGLDGLRQYLDAQKKDVIVRQFCRKLLGYALGRSTSLADSSLIDEMVAALNKNEGHIGAAVLTIVRSPQFRMIRGTDVASEE